MSTPAAPTVRTRFVGRPPLAPVLVAAALVSAAVVTLGAPLVPMVRIHFGLSEEAAQWSYTITLLTGAALTPVLGRLADGRRRRPAMIAVCLLVALGCVLSAVPGPYGLFLAGRALQGLGVALVAMTIATARDHASGARAVRLVALLSVTTAVGAGLSYPVTTSVAQWYGLGAAFGGAAGLGVLITLAVILGLPAMVDAARPRGLDVVGALLLVIGTGLGLLGISQGNSWGWTDARLLALGGAALLALVAWVAVELRQRNPLVELRLMAHHDVLIANGTAVLMGISLYALPVLISRLALAPPSSGYGAGLPLAAVGLVMMPIAIGGLLGSRSSVFLAARWGPYAALAIGAFVAALGPLTLVLGSTGLWSLVVAIGLSAFGSGATFGMMANLIVAAVDPAQTGSATSLNLLLRAVGGALGSAGTAAILGAHPGPGGLPTEWGFRLAGLACAASCLAALVLSLVLAALSRASRRAARPASPSADDAAGA
ncbi:MFS transporter [Micromonospora zingiberis]|uniref:MFS transporter n=1 Tax=Micromonospora zingiberis TaxID=2053011 RepID=A0A4R0GJ48_9ACTN|nr:MFS transporter [Micromonospora zingiberis]TCB97226.1 MFS transporter [Micromonospora zingiberis]